MSASATMTSKGQITVPKEVRDDLGLVNGSRILFAKLPDGSYRLAAKTGSIEDLIGMLYDPARAPLTIDEINEAIAEGGAASGTRGIYPDEDE